MVWKWFRVRYVHVTGKVSVRERYIPFRGWSR